MIRLLQTDNVQGMGQLETEGRRFALAYLDPPFFTQMRHRMLDSEEIAFEDRWPDLETFVTTIASAAMDAWRLLIPEGSLVLHVDPKTSHYLKVAVDHLIGQRCFASEIVWRYRRWPTHTHNFQRVHDVLLRYVRDPDAGRRWNQLYEPLSQKTADQWGQQKQRAVKEDGSKGEAKRIRSSATDEASPGAPLGDVWEIGIIGPSSDERNGYPTQKPEKLLARLIQALTNEGDHVLDPYCGSGTTLAVAHRLGRHAVGIDSSAVACRVARERITPLLAAPFLPGIVGGFP